MQTYRIAHNRKTYVVDVVTVATGLRVWVTAADGSYVGDNEIARSASIADAAHAIISIATGR